MQYLHITNFIGSWNASTINKFRHIARGTIACAHAHSSSSGFLFDDRSRKGYFVRPSFCITPIYPPSYLQLLHSAVIIIQQRLIIIIIPISSGVSGCVGSAAICIMSPRGPVSSLHSRHDDWPETPRISTIIFPSFPRPPFSAI